MNTIENSDKKSCDLMNFCIMDPEKLPIYKIVTERFIRCFRVSFSNTLRMLTNLEVKKIERVPFADYISNTKAPCFMTIFKLDTLKGPGMMAMDLPLSYGIIDIVFGGNSKPYSKALEKELTQIDLTICREFADLFLSDLNEAWKPVHEVKAAYVRTEINPQFIGIVPPKEDVLLTDIDVSFEGVNGKMQIVLPMQTLFPIRDKLI